MAQFFDRHAKVDASYFYDDTTMTLNTWVTEVHFRFFRARRNKDEVPKQSSQCVRQLNAQPCGIFGRDAFLIDAVISFRIVGDYFDRYWTCHVVEEIMDQDLPLDKQNTHWQQRKVLELMLFNRILEKVCHSLDEILKDIEVGPGSSSLDAGKRYFSSASFEDRKPEELRECFQLLVILKNNATNLLGLIEQWTNRESSRGRDRPRWTRNDEQKYRKSIKQKMAHLEDHIRDIKAKTARIEFLIALVTNAQDAVRSKKSLKEAENINLFTYVTVFFLPVGLAVSIFSMNGTPDHTVISYMVITAAVALLVTAFLLWCVHSQLLATHLRGLFDYVLRQGIWHITTRRFSEERDDSGWNDSAQNPGLRPERHILQRFQSLRSWKSQDASDDPERQKGQD